MVIHEWVYVLIGAGRMSVASLSFPSFRCPKCLAPSNDLIHDHKNNITCKACGFIMAHDGDVWDARLGKGYPLDFSRQWQLWEEGRFGDTRRVYGKTDEEDFKDLLGLIGLSCDHLRGMAILEIGFGHGRILREIQRHCPSAFGLDLVRPLPSSKLLASSVICGDLLSIPLMPAQFDLVICRGVVHHTSDPSRAFRCAADQVRPHGILYAYIYEESIPKSLALRRMLPWSWRFPESVRIGLSAAVATVRASLEAIKKKGFSRADFSQSMGNYMLGTYDVLSPRWTTRHHPDEVLSWFAECGFDAVRKAACQYVGVRSMKP